MNPHRIKAYLLLLFVSIIWAAAGPVIKFTLGEIPPLLFLTYRFFLSAVFAVVYMIFTGINLPKDKRTLFSLFLYGLFTSTISLGLLFFGLKDSTVLELTIMNLVGPLMIILAGVIYLKEHVTQREKIGLAIALLGTALTTVEPLITNGKHLAQFSGNLLILLYLVATTIPTVLAKKLLRENVNPVLMTNLAFIIGFVTLLPFLLLQSRPTEIFSSLQKVSLAAHLGVFYMAFLSGVLAYWLSNVAQKTIEIGEAALFTYLYPVISIPLAVFWLHEKITPSFLVGGIIVIVGVAIAEIKKTRYN